MNWAAGLGWGAGAEVVIYLKQCGVARLLHLQHNTTELDGDRLSLKKKDGNRNCERLGKSKPNSTCKKYQQIS